MGEPRLENQFEDWVQIKGMVTYAISCLSMGASVEILREALEIALLEYENKWVRPSVSKALNGDTETISSSVKDTPITSNLDEETSMKTLNNKAVTGVGESVITPTSQGVPVTEARSTVKGVSTTSSVSSKKAKSGVSEATTTTKVSTKEGIIPSGRFKTGLVEAAISDGVFNKRVPESEANGQLTFSDIATSETEGKQSVAKVSSASKSVAQHIETKKHKSKPIVEDNSIETDKLASVSVEKPAVENVQTPKSDTVTQSKSSSSLLQYCDGGITEAEKQAFDKARSVTNYLNADDKLSQTSSLRRGRILNTTLLSRFYLLRSGGAESKVCIRIEVNVDSSREFGDTIIWRVLSGSVLSGVSPVRNYSDEYRNIRGGLLKTYAEAIDDGKYYVVNKTTDWFSSSALWMGVILLGNMNSLATRLSVVTSTTNKDIYDECKKAVC